MEKEKERDKKGQARKMTLFRKKLWREVIQPTAIAKYGENHWWESDDLIIVARHQIFEKILLVDFDLFLQGIGKLLGRPVWTHEFGLNIEGLRKEAKEAITILDATGNPPKLSEKKEQDKIGQVMNSLSNFCLKNNKSLIAIETPGKEK